MRLTRRGGGRRSVTCHDGHAIGLDLGATTVRAAVLTVEQRDGRTHVHAQRLGGVALEPGTVVNGAVVDAARLTAALKELWRHHRITCRNVILGVASPQAQLRELQMPDLDPARRAQALPYQAREVIAMPLDQVVLDYAPLSGPDPETGLVDGLLVVTPRTPVSAAVAAVEAAGLKVVRVDLASLAVLRAAAEPGLAAEAVIDLGAQLTTIVVHEGGVPKLARTLTRGGDELTRGLSERMRTSLEEAEQAKRLEGLATPGPVSDILTDLVAPLLTDIRSSLNYFRTGHVAARIQQVSLTGRAAGLPGLGASLGNQVGADVVVAAPSRLLEADGSSSPDVRDDDGWASAIAVGLAIGAAA